MIDALKCSTPRASVFNTLPTGDLDTRKSRLTINLRVSFTTRNNGMHTSATTSNPPLNHESVSSASAADRVADRFVSGDVTLSHRHDYREGLRGSAEMWIPPENQKQRKGHEQILKTVALDLTFTCSSGGRSFNSSNSIGIRLLPLRGIH